jgi:AraC family transcriptional regulator of adaptative response / DNA-3-methyladenine glycosylase II
VKAASLLAERIAKAVGQRISNAGELTHLFPTPEILADAKLANLGLSDKRAETIRTLTRAVCDGKISYERTTDSEAFEAQLRQIPGIGSWTAQYVAMRALRETDALPEGDPVLLRALSLKTSRELEKRADAWRPWRSYASMYLWGAANG